MKNLYLIRHAKSSWDSPHLPDFERPLNGRGKRNAPEMGQRLKTRGVFPDHVASSPAVRARETILRIAEEIEFPERRISFLEDVYAAGAGTLLEIIYEFPEEAATAFLVGHNPGMTSLAEYLTGASIGNIPTCGIASIEFDLGCWSHISRERGNLLYLDYPKKEFRL